MKRKTTTGESIISTSTEAGSHDFRLVWSKTRRVWFPLRRLKQYDPWYITGTLNVLMRLDMSPNGWDDCFSVERQLIVLNEMCWHFGYKAHHHEALLSNVEFGLVRCQPSFSVQKFQYNNTFYNIISWILLELNQA